MDDELRRGHCADISYYIETYDDFNTLIRQGDDFIKIKARYFSRDARKRNWKRFF